MTPARARPTTPSPRSTTPSRRTTTTRTGWEPLEALARRAGLSGRRLLDVGCGTGKSFAPFLARGYDVTACDVSGAMLARAAERAGGRVRLERHDMRSLPRLGAFDLVCCIDDAVNYLDSEAELAAACAGFERNLAPGGVLVFDANTVRAYRDFFATPSAVVQGDRVMVMDGQSGEAFAEGGLSRSEIMAFEPAGDDAWRRALSVHLQRHHPRERVLRALATAGLTDVTLYGMHVDGSCDEGFDELSNSKAVYIARRGAPESRKEVSH